MLHPIVVVRLNPPWGANVNVVIPVRGLRDGLTAPQTFARRGRSGMRRTVRAWYDGAVLVEIVDDNGRTLGLLTVSNELLEVQGLRA